MAKAPSLRKDRNTGTQRTRKLSTGNALWSWRNGKARCVRARRETAGAKPYTMQVCAVSRTDGIATRGGRSSGQTTPRRPPNLDPKGRGDKSMVGKRGQRKMCT